MTFERLAIAAALALSAAAAWQSLPAPATSGQFAKFIIAPGHVIGAPETTPDYVGDLPWSRPCEPWEPFGVPYLTAGFRRCVLEKPA